MAQQCLDSEQPIGDASRFPSGRELLHAIRAGDDIDVIRKGVELLMPALIDAQATEQSGAELHECSESGTNWRSGSRERLLSTKAGDVELKDPEAPPRESFPRSSSAADGSVGRCSRW